jgi:hypothetical protein
MTFEKFTKQQNPDWPSVTIRKNGSLCLNRKAIDEFNIGAMRFATLHYDESDKLLAIKPEPDHTDPSAFKISREKNKTSVIYCQAFLKHCQIPYAQGSKTYRARWDDKIQMILVKIA